MKTLATFLPFLALTGCVEVDVKLGVGRGSYSEKVIAGDSELKAKIALIDVEGVLSSDEEDSIFGSKESQVVALVEKLKMAESDSDVKAVVVRIDSPGGDVTTSDILYNELVRFKER